MCLCMSVNVCVSECVCVHGYICVRVNVSVCLCLCEHMYLCVVCLCECTYVFLCLCEYVSVFLCLCAKDLPFCFGLTWIGNTQH